MGFEDVKNDYNSPEAIAKLEAIKAIQAKELKEKQANKLAKLKEAEEKGEIVYEDDLH